MSPDLKWLMLFQCGQISAASCVFHSHYHPEASLVPGLPLCWFCLPPIPSPFFPYSSDSPMLLHHHFQPYPPPLCREFCPPTPVLKTWIQMMVLFSLCSICLPARRSWYSLKSTSFYSQNTSFEQEGFGHTWDAHMTLIVASRHIENKSWFKCHPEPCFWFKAGF